MAIGAGLGSGFINTKEIHLMKYEEAICKDPVGWGQAVADEHKRMTNHKVFQAVKKSEIPKGSNILTQHGP